MQKRELTHKRREKDEVKQKKDYCREKAEMEYRASKEGLKLLTRKAKFHLCEVKYDNWIDGTFSSSWAWMWIPRHNSIYGIFTYRDYGPQVPFLGRWTWFFSFRKKRMRLRDEVIAAVVEERCEEEVGFLMQEYSKEASVRKEEADHIRLEFQILLGHRDSEFEELWDPRRECWFYYRPENKDLRFIKPAICENCGNALEISDLKCFKCDTIRSEANQKLFVPEKNVFPEQIERNNKFDPYFVDPEELKNRPPMPPGTCLY